eukprot:Skav215232  [mRNA]  locus=scaffold341:303529:313128:+ [translate_table: standard]
MVEVLLRSTHQVCTIGCNSQHRIRTIRNSIDGAIFRQHSALPLGSAKQSEFLHHRDLCRKSVDLQNKIMAVGKTVHKALPISSSSTPFEGLGT